MRSPASNTLVLITLAALGCNQTTPTTAPEPGGATPTMPEEPATDDEVFDDEPVAEDERDVDDAG